MLFVICLLFKVACRLVEVDSLVSNFLLFNGITGTFLGNLMDRYNETTCENHHNTKHECFEENMKTRHNTPHILPTRSTDVSNNDMIGKSVQY